MNPGISARITLSVGIIALSLCGVAAARGMSNRSLSGPPGDDPFAGKCAPRLAQLLASSRASDTLLVWIFFVDRARDGVEPARSPQWCVSSRAAWRRSLRARDRYDEHDRPVCRAYIDALRPHVLGLRHASRYFNAVGARVAPSELSAVCAHRFVDRIDLVAVGTVRVEPPAPGPDRSEAFSAASPTDDGYGGSYCQLNQIAVIPFLEQGYNGSGAASGNPPVLIGVLDTGFNRDHGAFSSIHVEAEWDFVQNDPITWNEPGDLQGQDSHGTCVLGVIAGHAPGQLIGPAWGAHYILAKTEIANTRDVRVEEDYWVRGIEWCDSVGADIVTSSLAFPDWYDSSDLDGHTALCTRAAGIAASHGIIVVNAAGNNGASGFQSLVAPADGDSVFSIGAVSCSGAMAPFSSKGPTADGRTKPDFVDMGVSSRSVSTTDPSAYSSYDGTSLAAPLFAGGCALLLEMHPDWDPMRVRSELRASASRTGSPDNIRGWGIPNFQLAAGCPSISEPTPAHPNPFRDATIVEFFYRYPQLVTARVYDCRGALVKTLVSREVRYCSWHLSWDGTDDAGTAVAAGVYFVTVRTNSAESTAKVIRIR